RAQLALLEADSIIAEASACLALEVEGVPRRDRALVLGISQEQAARRDLVLGPIGEAEIRDAGQRDLVRRALLLEILLRGIQHVADRPLAVPPRVVVRQETECADFPSLRLPEEPAIAERGLQSQVRAERPSLEVDVAIKARCELAVHRLRVRERDRLARSPQRVVDADRADVAAISMDGLRDLGLQGTRAVV